MAEKLAETLSTPAGFEPATTRLEGECSIQLSYGVICSVIFRVTPGTLKSVAYAVIAEIVRIAFRLLAAFVQLDDRKLKTILGRKCDRLLFRREMQAHFIQ